MAVPYLTIDNSKMNNEGLFVEGLRKVYKSKIVLMDFSISLKKGEVVSLLGPNGSGKTTAFNIIAGISRSDGGTVKLDGYDISNLPMYRRSISGLGYLPQESSIFKGLTVEKNIQAILELKIKDKRDRRRKLEELLGDFSITHLRQAKANNLSGGERRLLEISRALVMRPSILLVDEPSIGLEPRYIDMVFEILGDLQQNEKKQLF